jgi:Ni/Co efflux regulator RcnB
MPSTVRLLAVGIAFAMTPVWALAEEPHGNHREAPAHAAPAAHPQPAPTIHNRPPPSLKVNNQARVIPAPNIREHQQRTGRIEGQGTRGQVRSGQVSGDRVDGRNAPRSSGPKVVEFSHSRTVHVIQPYHPPRGYRYRYRVWVVGEVLPRPYWARSYWLSDYWDYGLDEPPEGYEWVRYGPDALLVDLQTGQVVEVARGVFY